MCLDRRLIDGLEQFDYVTSFKVSASSANGHRIEGERERLQKRSIVVFLEGHNGRCMKKSRDIKF